MEVSRENHPNALAPVADLLRGLPVSAAMIEAAERTALRLPQVSCPVVHRFGPGICVREVFIPAGTFAIGHYQRFEQINIFLKGRVTVIGDDGSTRELVAPMFFVGPPGRKVGIVHEDVVWLNVWATDETDVEKIEAHFLDKSAAWTYHAEQQYAERVMAHQEDRDDFALAIAELGFTAEQVREMSAGVDDVIPFPPGSYKVRISGSPIEGRGLFATADIAPGERIAPGRINGRRTPAGRLTNHAKVPNARFEVVSDSGDMDLFAIAPIAGARGGQDGDEITVDYRESVAACKRFVNKE